MLEIILDIELNYNQKRVKCIDEFTYNYFLFNHNFFL